MAEHSAIEWTDAPKDDVYPKLRKAVERRITSWLWVKGDTPPFKPAALPGFFGDGRALFSIATINQRPRYYVIRCDSSWGCYGDREGSAGPDFGEMTDEIMRQLIDHFGGGRCGYSGNSLFWPKRERLKNCQCEECAAGPMARWPMVDDDCGSSWSRLNWPNGFPTVADPRTWGCDLLDGREWREMPK